MQVYLGLHHCVNSNKSIVMTMYQAAKSYHFLSTQWAPQELLIVFYQAHFGLGRGSCYHFF